MPQSTERELTKSEHQRFLVFGADFEFVQRPQRVIVLDDVDEDNMDEDEWEYVQDLVPARKLPEPAVEVVEVVPRTSYAAMVKA